MPVPAGVIVMWPGANATIPGGWSRVTSLDDRYVKGAAAGNDPGDTGGATTHTHTSDAHSHSIASHVHGGVLVGAPGIGSVDASVGEEISSIAATHTHTASPDSSSAAGTSGATAAAWNTASTDPPFVRVIFIASDGTPDGVPVGGWAWWDEDTLPGDWSQPATAKDRHPKGAVAGGNGGETGGGGAHQHTAQAHSHTAGHTHTGTLGGVTGGDDAVSLAVVGVAEVGHDHALSYGSSGVVATATSDSTGETTYEPPWRKLAVVQNDTVGPQLPTGLIAAFLGLRTAVPAGWVLCDGEGDTLDMRGRFPKGADDLAEVDDSGGALGHTHDAPSGHTHASHNHPVTSGGPSASSQAAAGGQALASNSHTHGSTTSDSSAASIGSVAQGVNANADTQPPFRTVLFIKFVESLTVTVTEPESGGSVAQPGFTVEWDAEDDEEDPVTQQSYRVRIYDDDQATVLYDSGWVASAVQQHQVGAWAATTGQSYYLVVDVVDTDNLQGSSGFHLFETAWTPPAQITNVTVTAIGGDA